MKPHEFSELVNNIRALPLAAGSNSLKEYKDSIRALLSDVITEDLFHDIMRTTTVYYHTQQLRAQIVKTLGKHGVKADHG